MAEPGLLSADLRLAGRLDARFFALLQAVHDTGSINRAAKTAGYSYKGAWLLLETAANLAHEPLLSRSAAGSQLTATGLALIDLWRELHAAQAQWLRTQETWLHSHPTLTATLRRLAMKTSARNQFVGLIEAMEVGPVTTELRIAIRGGQAVTALLASSAAERLDAHIGQEAVALIKASSIVLVSDFAGFKLSASNQLAGTVSRISPGAVSTLVGLTLPGGVVVTASLTKDAVEALGLTIGQPASAVFKASAVLVAVPG